MNIDDLTLGQIRNLQSLFGGTCESPGIYKKYIGKYVICRSRNEGVNAGTVIDIDETGVVLEGARRLYYHKPKDKSVSWYEGVAVSGLGEGCKVGVAREKLIAENYSLTVCSDEAKKSIHSCANHEQG